MKYLILIIAIVGGLFMRAYQYDQRFMYGHDNDLASWIVKDVVVDAHSRLIGQLTSQPGIFIGSLYYYSIIPFYWLTSMDPIGSVLFSIIVGVIAIASIYWVFNKLFGIVPARIAALLYAFSNTLSRTEREVVPTTPVMLWSIWFFYCVSVLFKGQRGGLYLAAILIALIWHMNMALVLLVPLLVVAVVVQRKAFRLKDILLAALLCCVLNVPLVAFEARHGFSQTRALLSSFTRPKTQQSNLIAKAQRTILLSANNATGLFLNDRVQGTATYVLPAILLIVGLGYAFAHKQYSLHARLVPLWMGFYLVFFSVHPIVLSEYYLNGMNIVWLFLATLTLTKLLRGPQLMKVAGGIIMVGFIVLNVHAFLTTVINRSGYVERKAVVDFITQDAKAHNYPCVAVSYITSPGNELGYRYLFWLARLRVNPPKSLAPVYTIVFPHSYVDALDKTFGALGVVLPDYQRYTEEGVAQSCAGEDANLTEPMFGFTK